MSVARRDSEPPQEFLDIQDGDGCVCVDKPMLDDDGNTQGCPARKSQCLITTCRFLS